MMPVPPAAPIGAHVVAIKKILDRDLNDVTGAVIRFHNRTKHTATVIRANEADGNIAIPVAKIGAFSNGDAIRITITKGHYHKTLDMVIDIDEHPMGYDLGEVTLTSRNGQTAALGGAR